jgi:radical SAM superfamily enzyme YgiQ (UPF0313 family)
MLEKEPDVVLFTEVCSAGFGRYAGTYRIATELRDQGYTVQVIEYFTIWSTAELLQIVRKFVTHNCLWVGVSTTFLSPDTHRKRADVMSMPESFTGRNDWPEIVSTIRDINPRCLIVAGGAKADMIPHTDTTFDVIISGQGETSATYISDQLFARRDVSRLQSLPYDNYPKSTIKFEDNDIIFPGEHLPVEIARGCIFKCSFCNYPLNGKKLWEFNRQPRLVREDINDVHNKFGSTGFMFCDDNYNDSPDKVKRFHKEFMKLDYDIQFSTYARADLIFSNWETAKLLYESGLRSVFFGIESLNHESAKSIGKGMDSEKIKDGLYKLKEECPELVVCIGMIVGLPHDTEDTLRKNNEWLLQDDCPVDGVTYHPLHISPTSPFLNNSKMSNQPDKYGYQVDEHGFWVRNDGLDKDTCVNLSRELTQSLADVGDNDRLDKFGRVGSFTFFNRLQNIGYSVEDFKNGIATHSGCIDKEKQMQHTYHERLMAL